MKNVLLGKVLKAMYKLSGKTLTQLSEESDLTIDTINNLFYARIQKPGFIGVCAFVNAAGFTVQELTGYMEKAADTPAEVDITDDFTQYVFSAESTRGTVTATTPTADTATVPANSGSVSAQLEALSASHEKELDRFRLTHQHYVEQLQVQYHEQISQLEDSFKRLKEHYDHSVGEVKKAHAEEMRRQDETIKSIRRMNLVMGIVLAIETVAVILMVVP